MPIVVTCPGCSTTLKAPDNAAGRRLKCPKCTSAIDVPAPAPPEEIVEDLPAGAIQEEPAAPMPAHATPQERAPAPPPGQISRQTVGLIAIGGAGALGIHKFILGKNQAGLIMLLVGLLGCGIGFFVMLAIGMMEGIAYLRMSDEEFYATYVAGEKAWM